jgi:hypothetical protein
MSKEQLDNLTKGTRPSLHAATPNWDTLKGLRFLMHGFFTAHLCARLERRRVG